MLPPAAHSEEETDTFNAGVLTDQRDHYREIQAPSAQAMLNEFSRLLHSSSHLDTLFLFNRNP